jgi:polyene macrolide polyketide synthase
VLGQTGFAQPALFAVQVALYRLVESLGVCPDFVAGHSVGEIAAAHVAGVLSLDDACRLVAARAGLMQALPVGGAMVAVAASEAEVLPLLTAGVSIAAVNGPSSVVVSGVEEEVLAVAARFAKSSRLRVSHAFHSPLMEPMLGDFAAVVEGLSFAEPSIPVVANGDVACADYWVRQVRDVVRFADVVGGLRERQVSRFVEIGPDGVLTAMVQTMAEDAVAVAVLRKNTDERTAFVNALSSLFVSGAAVDLAAFCAGGRIVDLPTYAFQRRRFWVNAESGTGDAGAVGQRAISHPLLGAAVWSPDSGGVVLTGRLSLGSQPWLADHVVLGRVLVPGTAFVELAVRAGDEVGCGFVEELTLGAPLVLPDTGGMHIQVTVGADDAGRRSVAVHSRPEDGDGDWTRHASGYLTAQPPPRTDAFAAGVWPPAGAEPVDVGDAYATIAGAGFGYGPVFQGLQALWKNGPELYAEIALPESARADAARFGIHPALLDATMHPAILTGARAGGGPAGAGTSVPFAWSGVALHAVGASTVRVRIARSPGSADLAIDVADGAGHPVLSVATMASRPVSSDQLGTTGNAGSLLEIGWQPVEADAEASWDEFPGEGAPVVVFDTAGRDVRSMLGVLQSWTADARLVVVTRRAVAIGADDDVDLAQAPIWGLVRAAQAENPGRFQLLDIDNEVTVIPSGEPEAAVRAGRIYVPRLTPVTATGAAVALGGSVLITGGTGGLGAVIARYLVAERGVEHVVLTSRRGPDAPGAADLVAELGGRAEVVACDVSDRKAVTELIADTTAQWPLTAVVHAAGVADNGLISSLTPERIDGVFAAKADAAWYLHEATAGLPLAAFVLLSSAGGLVLAAGQGNYAAANVYLDALAQHRRVNGLPATAIAFGLWDVGAGLAQYVGDVDRKRMAAQGLPVLDHDTGLALFAQALDAGRPALAALRLDNVALRARTDTVPALLRGLAPQARRTASAGPAKTATVDLAGMSPADQHTYVLDLVRGQIAAVLGHAGAVEIAPDRPFTELGFDSLSAVEFRNGLSALTGVRLPATLVFDHPSPNELAEHLRGQLAPATVAGPAAILADLERLAATIGDLDFSDELAEQVGARLDILRTRWNALRRAPEEKGGDEQKFDFESASDEDVFDLLDKQLGLS